jgi:hypothetical protein
MKINEKLLLEIMHIHESKKLKFILNIAQKSFPLSRVKITNSSTPLSKPNVRGGVYFSDTSVFKIVGTTNDLSLLPLLSKSMLGPNSQFQELEIVSKIPQNNNSKNVSIYTNLTNSMRTSSNLELSMNIVGVK